MLLYPQKLDFLTQNIIPKHVAQEDFTYRYYAPWIRTHLPAQKDASWANTSFGIKGRYYGENLQLISDEEIDTLIATTNFEAYGSINAHAIMIYNEQMRALLTQKPFFKNDLTRRRLSV